MAHADWTDDDPDRSVAMTTIEVMLEALKSTRPSRQHCTSNEQWDAAMDFHDQAIALGEAELRREPDAEQYQSRDGGWKNFISDKHRDDTKAEGSWPVRELFAREEIK